MTRPRLTALVLALAAVAGCEAVPKARTTFLRSVDLVDMTNQMARSFAARDVVSSRRPDDAAWVVSVDRIANRTNQIIPEREKWLYIARLRARLAESEVGRERAIIWVIPPERWPMVAEELGGAEEPYGLRLDPTHLMTGEFSVLTTTAAAGRTDAYLCSYQLVDLATGVIVWEDAWEVKRSVQGLVFD